MAGWDPVPVQHVVKVNVATYPGLYDVVGIKSTAEHETLPIKVDHIEGPMGFIVWTVKLRLESSDMLDMHRNPHKITAEGTGPTRSAAEDNAFLSLVF